MPATAMNHFTILTDQLDETVKFYREFLNLEPGDRPPFKFPGAWMYSSSAKSEAILHIISGKSLPAQRAGVIDHMAFSATGLLDTLEKLKARDIEYDLRHLPGSGTWQLFFFDPNGAKVELDFDASEPGPA